MYVCVCIMSVYICICIGTGWDPEKRKSWWSREGWTSQRKWQLIGNLRDSRPLHCSKNEVLKAFRLLVRAKSCPYTHSDLSSITYTLSLSMLLLNCCNHLRAESAHIAFFPVIFFTLPVTFFRRHFYLSIILSFFPSLFSQIILYLFLLSSLSLSYLLSFPTPSYFHHEPSLLMASILYLYNSHPTFPTSCTSSPYFLIYLCLLESSLSFYLLPIHQLLSSSLPHSLLPTFLPQLLIFIRCLCPLLCSTSCTWRFPSGTTSLPFSSLLLPSILT